MRQHLDSTKPAHQPLKDRYEAALESLQQLEDDYSSKVAHGYLIFEGKPITSGEKQRILLERAREEQRRDLARQHEQQAAQGRALREELLGRFAEQAGCSKEVMREEINNELNRRGLREWSHGGF
jgi:hypothetical protein